MKVSVQKNASNFDYEGILIPYIKGEIPSSIFINCDESKAIFDKKEFECNNEELFHFTRIENGNIKHIFLLGLGEKSNEEKSLFAFSSAFNKLNEYKLRNIIIDFNTIDYLSNIKRVLISAVIASVLSGYRFDKYKSIPDDIGFEKVIFITENYNELKAICDEGILMAESTILARDLINEPPTVMIPDVMANKIKNIFKSSNVSVTVYKKEEIKKLGLSAFLEVSKGSIYDPRLIVIEYRGNKKTEDIVSLVGKGVTYDSGGYSLKSTATMETMQHDMSGGAAVASAIYAISSQSLKINVLGVIAACENKLSATAYVPGDIIPSMSGKFIEVNNTDAEGRITLADAVTFVKTHYKPSFIIDIATLTDAIQTALGDRRAGVFSNNKNLVETISKAGDMTVEPVWELPCDDYIKDVISSRVAHIKNSAMGSDIGAYATVGALFVREFVGETPWAHIDMAGVAWKCTDDYYFTKGGVGFGTRLLYQTIKLLSEKG